MHRLTTGEWVASHEVEAGKRAQVDAAVFGELPRSGRVAHYRSEVSITVRRDWRDNLQVGVHALGHCIARLP